MEINKYALFADVAETKNFTKSGDNMGYTQPGVSHILKSMENELGFELFSRTKQGIRLTTNAEAILPIVRRLLAVNEQLEQTIASLNGLETGHLTIATFASISRNWLPAFIHNFQKSYPGVEIELLEGGTDDIVGWVSESVADFGLMSHLHTGSLEWIPLYEDPLVAVLPKNYYEGEAPDAFPIREILEQPFILSAQGIDYDIHYALDKAGIHPESIFSSTDDTTIVAMVANQLGISILPKLTLQDLNYPVLQLPLEPYASRELGIAFRSHSSLSPATSHFISSVQKTLKEMLSV